MASSVLGLLAIWWAVFAIGVFPEIFFPSPLQVVKTGVVMFTEQDFATDIGASTARILFAFAASAVLAVPIGIWMSSFKVLEGLLGPVVDFVRYVPVPALVPLFVLWTGIGEEPKFLVLFFGTFFQLVLLVKDDADQVPSRLFELARTMGARTPQLFRDVLLPAMMPQLYDRLRVTLGWCWTYLVIAELVAVENGVGHVIKEAQRFNAADQLFVCLITLGFIGLLTDYIAKLGYGVFFRHTERGGAAQAA